MMVDGRWLMMVDGVLHAVTVCALKAERDGRAQSKQEERGMADQPTALSGSCDPNDSQCSGLP